MKGKLLVVVLLIVCFTLAGALYATAAPSKPPLDSALTARISALTSRVKGLELAVNALGKTTPCEITNLWNYAESIKSAVKLQKPYLVPDWFQPACP